MTEQDIKNFNDLFRGETGQTLSLEEAKDCAESLVEMVRLVYKPITKKDYEKCTNNPYAI